MTRRRTVALCLAVVAAVAGTLALSGGAVAATGDAATGDAATATPTLAPVAGGLVPAAGGRAPVAGGLVPAAGGLVPAAGDLARGRLIVRVAPGADVTEVAAAVRAAGARVLGVQQGIGTLVAQVPAGALAAVRAVPGVLLITADYEITSQSLGFDPWTQAGSMTSITAISGANAMWRKGYTGNGIDVALIDTGVAPVPGLNDSAKVVVGPDLSFESQDADLRYLDTHGHGTHMAGIIGGRERAKGNWWDYAWDNTNFYGMAPDSRLVSLKLADHNGVVDVSQIIAAVDWVVQNRLTGGLSIRVLNLSYGTHSPQSPQADPLSWAAEVAWQSGIVVVTSAGNDGDRIRGLTNPAYNPWVIAVGSADTKGTTSMADDTVPSFSARQGGNFNTRGIDIVAPGVSLVSLGVPGSYVYQSNPSARVGNGLLRGSGTSQSAAVVSGGAALLLSQRPELTPNQVKELLIKGATKLTGEPTTAQGKGELNLTASADLATPPSTQVQSVGNGTGGLESARGGIHVTLSGRTLADERDIMGNSFVSPTLSQLAHGKAAWGQDGSFNGAVWIGTGFTADSTSWAGKTWSGKTWSGKTWSGKTWSGDTWSGKTWSDSVWSDSVWTGSGWAWTNWAAPLGTDAWAGAAWGTDIWG